MQQSKQSGRELASWPASGLCTYCTPLGRVRQTAKSNSKACLFGTALSLLCRKKVLQRRKLHLKPKFTQPPAAAHQSNLHTRPKRLTIQTSTTAQNSSPFKFTHPPKAAHHSNLHIDPKRLTIQTKRLTMSACITTVMSSHAISCHVMFDIRGRCSQLFQFQFGETNF